MAVIAGASHRYGSGLDELIAQVAGPPFFANPLEVADTWSMPQLIYMWAMGRDMVNLDRKVQLIITSGSITATLSKNGKSIMRRLTDMFDGPQKTVEQMYEELSDIQRLVMFGMSQQDDDGSQTDSN